MKTTICMLLQVLYYALYPVTTPHSKLKSGYGKLYAVISVSRLNQRPEDDNFETP